MSDVFLLERFREAARNFTETASREQLETFLGPDKVATILKEEQGEMSLVSKLESGDQKTLASITQFSAPVAVHLLGFLSVETARRLCGLNKDFKRWCDEINLMGEVRRIRDVRMRMERMEKGKRLAALFCRTQYVSVHLTNVNRPLVHVHLDDRAGDRGFFVTDFRDGFRLDVDTLNEILSHLPFFVMPGSSWVGVGGDDDHQPRRWYHGEEAPPGAEVVELFTKSGGDLGCVTQESREAYTTFFLNLLQNGWIVREMADHPPGDPAQPIPLNIDCVHCGTALEKVYTCSKCKKVNYCGKECQVSNWHAGHKMECQKGR